eukprot:516275_1
MLWHITLRSFTNNVSAIRKLKALHGKCTKHKSGASSIIKQALEIYDDIEGTKNETVIDTFVRLCIDCNTPHEVLSIWTDVEGNPNLSYLLLLKCCVRIHIRHPFDITKCIQILTWMKQSKQTYKKSQMVDYSTSICQLLSKCMHDSEVQQIHDAIRHNCKDIYIQTALIKAYSKHSNHTDIIWNIFNAIPEHKKDAVAVGTMMQCLMNHNETRDALRLYDRYYYINDDISHVMAIKACIRTNDFELGHRICSQIHTPDKQQRIELSNILIEFYATCGDMDHALEVFRCIKNDQKDDVTIATMMKWCVKNDKPQQALEIYNQFHTQTNDVSWSLAIQACIQANDLHMGRKIHSQLKHSRKPLSVALKNTLIDMYGKCGMHNSDSITNAMSIFNSIQDKDKDSVVLNTMMSALIHHNAHAKAVDLFEQYRMLHDGVSNLLAIKACIHIHDGLRKGEELYHAFVSHGFVASVKFKTALIDFYGSHSVMRKALDVFESISETQRDTICINSMMTTFINNECEDQAMELYDKYQSWTNDTSHVLALKAATNRKDYDQGRKICAKVETNRKQSIELLTALIDFYGECNDIKHAEQWYSTAKEQNNSVCLNVMMKQYVNNHCNDKALSLYDRSLMHHVSAVSHRLALKACMNLHYFAKGEHIITNVMKYSHDDDMEFKAAMIHFYGYFNEIRKAVHVFDGVRHNDMNIGIVNAMLNAYCDCKLSSQCVRFFETLHRRHPNIALNVSSYVLILKVCAQSTSIRFGKKVHEEIKGKPWLLEDKEIQLCLISFYGKCGMMDMCWDIFNGIGAKSKDSDNQIWNVMIHALGRNNDIESCQRLYNEMTHAYGFKPDVWTFRKLLNAYSYSGNVDKAQQLWDVITDQSIKYDSFVITTLIDCLARKGMVSDAKQIWIEYEENKSIMNHPNDKKMLMALMAGCSKCKNTHIGEEVYKEIKR